MPIRRFVSWCAERAWEGDGLVIRIERVEVNSLATASGTDGPIPTACKGDPFVAHLCPGCGTPAERRRARRRRAPCAAVGHGRR